MLRSVRDLESEERLMEMEFFLELKNANKL